MSSQPIRVSLLGADTGLADPLVVGPPEADDPGAPRFEAIDGTLGLLHVETTGRRRVLLVDLPPGERHGPARREVVLEGWRFEVELEPERRASLRERARRSSGDEGQSGPVDVRAIIPGVVVSVAVAAGDSVEAGQELLVVEAMKMQNELRAPRGGKIAQVAVGERSTIEVGDLLVVIE